MRTLDTTQEAALSEAADALRAAADLAQPSAPGAQPLAELDRGSLHALLTLIHRRLQRALG